MTKRKKTSPFSKRTGAGDYGVGYSKPPEGSRFQPGKSGNPRGRPKGAKSKARDLSTERLQKIVLLEAGRIVKIQEKGRRPTKMTVAEVMIRTLAVKALKGETRALKLFAEMQMIAETDNRRQYEQLLDEMLDYKARCEAEIERCKARGIKPPDFLPHPDDIVVEPTGDLIIKGPMTEEEKIIWDETRKKLEKYERALIEIDATYNLDEYKDHQDAIEEEREFYAKMCDICRRTLEGRRFPAP